MAVKRQLVFGVASVAALYASLSNALGLGEVELQSALNQPLNATIQLQGSEGVSPEDIRVSLAGADAFANAGIERPFFLSDLRFVPVVKGNELFIRVESSKPVLEPYLNFLVELRQPSGRVLREYTLLLDPPLYHADTRSRSQSPARETASTTAPRTVDRSTNRTSSAPAQPPLPDISAQPGADTYDTVAGDTLWDIAAKTRPADSVSIRDTMLAIQALNPAAFIGGDIGRLRANARLVLPTAEQLGADAAKSPAQGAPRSAGAHTQSTGSRQVAADRIERDRASAPAAPAPEQRTLDTRSENGARFRIEESTPDTASAENQVLLDRLQSLEAKFNVLLNELDARDRQVANLQAELEVLRAAQNSEAQSVEAVSAPVGTVGSRNTLATESSVTGSDTPESGAIDAEVVMPEPQPFADETFFSRWWPAVLGLIAALLAALMWFRKRQRDEAERDTVAVDGHELTVPEAAAASRAAEAEGEANVAVQTTMVREAVSPRTTRPVDQVDGVELYITYGRFAEALVMLERAIQDNPKRLDLRYQELRVLAELGEPRRFTLQEQALLGLGGNPARIAEIKSRYPALFSGRSDEVEHVHDVQPLLDEDQELASGTVEPEAPAAASDDQSSELNLNDFTLDPDWDLIEGLTPAPGHRTSDEREDALDVDDEEMLKDGLRDLPEVEEVDDDENHFPGKRDDRQPQRDR